VIKKLDRYGLADSARNVFNNYNIVHYKTPTFVRLITLKLVHNALPSARRLRHMSSHIAPGTKCPFGCDAVDSAEHLFGKCEPVRHNYNSTCLLFKLPKIAKKDWNIGTLLGAKELLGRKQATFNSFFAFTAWQARTDSLSQSVDLPYLFSSTITKLLTRYCPNLIKDSLGDTLPPLPPNQRLGSSNKRTSKQRADARKAADAIITSIPPSAVIAYTDGGTHNSNPGPCGSGVFFPPSTTTTTATNLHYPLGWGTNNLSEIAAIGYAIKHFLDTKPLQNTQLHILTDSYLAYGSLVFYWRSDLYSKLIRTTRNIISHTKNSNPISIHWIAGHAGIAGNDAADDNATTAASTSNADPADIDLINDYFSTHFNFFINGNNAY
jgi:ribonuclease HI